MAPQHLSAAQLATLAAVAEAVAPPDCRLRVSAADVDVPGQLHELLARFDPQSARMIRLLTNAVRFGPLLAGYRHTYPHLNRAERETYLERAIEGSRWDHDPAISLRALCEMVFAGDPRYRVTVGDDNQPFKRGLPVPDETPLPVIRYPQLQRNTTVDCDAVIVGSGAGGATVARELAEAGLDIIIVEEGGPPNRADFQERSALDRVVKYCRNNGLTTTIGTPVIPVPMGRVVGGTTVVNSGTCLRAPDAVLEEWAVAHGAELAAPANMGPRYDQLTERLNIQPVADDIMGNNGRIARRGAEELKLRSHPIPRPTRDCAGTGQCAFGCPRDAKQAMHLTQLPIAVQRGARIYAGCRVERILLQGRTATGVRSAILDERGRPTGHTLTVRARAVFLCAGALHTPLLLMEEGLGKYSGALGKHLRIHPGSGVTGRFDETVHGWQGVMQSFAIDDRLDEGVLLEATFPPLGMTYSAGALPGVGNTHGDLLADYAHMASLGSIVSDTSAGRVRSLPGLGPVMLYRMNDEDVRRTVSATALAARVLFAAGAREVYPGVPAAPTLKSEADVQRFETHPWRAKQLKVSAYHPMGTARMGRDPATSVCDPTGRLHETTNVYVADTSLFPGSTHVNPQFTLMALCMNIAQRYLDDHDTP